MPEPAPGYLLSLCRQASDLDYGLAITSNNVEALRQDIYRRLREEGLSPEDLDIELSTTPDPNTLYIRRRSVELPE